LTFAAIRIFSRLVAPLPSMDLVTFCAVPTLLGVVVLVACYIPALRAARVDPMDVLRGL
jgi:ABC-type lipoprotein release transport system permease subunit